MKHLLKPLKSKYLFLFILGVGFLLTYQNIFDSKVDTNGDNAGYYILAKSIATGQGYSNIHRPEAKPANHLPPGYPTIIASVFKVFGNKINTIKITNGLSFFLSLLVVFKIFNTLSNNIHLSFASTLLVLFNAHLLRFSTLMMSEIPFLLFSSLTILSYLKTDKTKPIKTNYWLHLFIILLASSFYIRTSGIALLAGVCFALLLEKQFKYLFTTILGFLILILPWQIRGQLLGGNSYIHQLFQKNPYRPELGSMDLQYWLIRLYANLKRYIIHEIPFGCFPNKQIDYQADIFLTDLFPGLIICALIILGISRLKQFKTLIIGYLLGSFGILLLWPEVWYGVRFLLPIVPFLLLLSLIGIHQLITWLIVRLPIKEKIASKSLPYIITCFCLIYTFPQLKLNHDLAKSPYPMNYNNYLFLAEWTKRNTDENSVICCRKDQLFYLFSNRKTVRYKNSLNKEEVIEDLKSKNVKYIVLDQLGFLSTPRYLYPAIQRYPEKFKIINHQKKPDTYLFEFKPDLGYWGQWKENQKHGKGKFTYSNGERFVGEWKNNVRNGKGTYYLNNGETLEGIWRNDSLINTITKN